MLRLTESAFNGYAKTYLISCPTECQINFTSFLDEAIPLIESVIQDELQHVNGIKFTLWFEVNYIHPTGEVSNYLRNFKTPTITVYRTTLLEDIRQRLQMGIKNILSEVSDFEAHNSGWTLESIYGLKIRLSKCTFNRGSP